MKYATHNCCYLYSTVHHSTLQYTAPGCFLLPVFKATPHLSSLTPSSSLSIYIHHSQYSHSPPLSACLPHKVYLSTSLAILLQKKSSGRLCSLLLHSATHWTIIAIVPLHYLQQTTTCGRRLLPTFTTSN